MLLLSGIFHGLRVLVFILLAWALGHGLGIVVVLFILPIIAFVSLLPISMGGIGLREGIITFCLSTFGLSLEVSLIVRTFSIIHSGLGGLIHVWSVGTPTSDFNRRSGFP